MFTGKGNYRSASGRAQTAGRAELQRQVEGRLGLWRLYVEAKWQELEEHRNPAGLQATPVVASASTAPVQRAGAARTGSKLSRPVEELPHESTPAAELPPTDDDLPRLDGEAT